MPKKLKLEIVYELLKDEPVTPNEIAKKLGVTHSTAKKALLELTLTKKDVKYKNSGRINLFWKTKK